MSSEPQHAAPEAKKSLRRAKQALYREAILDAAEAAFADAGYDATKVQTIARDAGISLATLYGVFPRKWDIFRALQETRLLSLMQSVVPHSADIDDPLSRLRFGIESYLRFHMDHPRFLAVQLREGVPWGTTDELRTPEQTRAWQAGLQLMIQGFREGIERGLFVDEDPELCARTATAMSQVRLALWIRRAQEESADSVVRAALLQLVRTFARPERVRELSARVRDDA